MGPAAVIQDEDPAEFELHRRRMLPSLAPDGPDQEAMAERIVALWWRLKRAERMQDEALDYLIEADRGSDWVKLRRSHGDPSAAPELTFGRAVARDFAERKTLDRLSMHERRIESSLYRTMNELKVLKRERTSRAPAASQPQDDPSCETKPMEMAGAVCSVPVRASQEVPSAKREASSAVPALQTSNLTLQTSGETPYGVTTNGVDSAKQSQSQDVSSVKCELSSGASRAVHPVILSV